MTSILEWENHGMKERLCQAQSSSFFESLFRGNSGLLLGRLILPAFRFRW